MARLERGDATLVASITAARGLNNGRGYSWRYVYEVLRAYRKNPEITAIHGEVVRMRTPKKRRA